MTAKILQFPPIKKARKYGIMETPRGYDHIGIVGLDVFAFSSILPPLQFDFKDERWKPADD